VTGSREVDPEERGHGSQVVGPSQEGEVLRVQLLGEFRVSVGDRTVEPGAWRLRKAKSLVKLLALAPGHRLHREQVLDLLWPDLDAMAATNNLYVALSAARRALLPSPSSACPYLRLRGDQLSLYPGGRLWVDVEVFESAAATARRTREPATYRSALDRYTGDLLPEDRYEDWAEHQRDSLRGTYLGLLDELARLHEQRGELGLAIEVLGRALIAEPMLEQTHVALMRLYALTGRRRQALRQYEQLREALERELDTEPDTASRRLYEDILARRFPPAEPSRAPHREVGDETRVRTTRPHNLPAQLTSFIGREREMAEVRRLLNTARLLTLSGAGGSGKTRLALEVASDFEGEYPDGMWLVELATLSDPALVPYAVALSLGVQEEPHRSLRQREEEDGVLS
jgi:DNA-binding SARP family transcriptional activator